VAAPPPRDDKELTDLKEILQKRDTQILSLYDEISQLQDDRETLTKQILDTSTNNSELISLSQAFNELEKLNIQKDETILQLNNQIV
jgi:predicted  nucleic acid-binding Zn-ribbon protein